MKTVKKTVANQCMWVRNQVSTFLSLVDKELPVNCFYNKYSLSLKGYIIQRCNFVKVFTSL